MSSYTRTPLNDIADGNSALASILPSPVLSRKSISTQPPWKPILIMGGRRGGTMNRTEWLNWVEAALELSRDEDLSDFPEQGLMKTLDEYSWFE